MRHAFIAAALDAGAALRDVQEAARHADPRTTMRYDRARVLADRRATYTVATHSSPALARSQPRSSHARNNSARANPVCVKGVFRAGFGARSVDPVARGVRWS